jgi:hypothetical protein
MASRVRLFDHRARVLHLDVCYGISGGEPVDPAKGANMGAYAGLDQ